MNLSASQLLALKNVTAYARSHAPEARSVMEEVLRMSDISRLTFETAVSKLKAHARIALHFHPDRLVPQTMRSVAESLLEQGAYKSQFETHLSSGSLSAYPGGQRDLWEKRLFGGAYHREDLAAGERPKYGALDVMRHPDGPAPRFGSCYLLLSPEVSKRSTYTYLDSHQNPKEKGTYEAFELILAALLKDAFFSDFAIGERSLTPRKWVDHLLANLEKPYSNPACKEPVRNLNHYIEAQVHGAVSLWDDAELLVADPSFKGTDTGRTLERLCRKYSIGLYWHMGFVLSADEVPSDFRGPAMPSLAKRIARHNRIDACRIGAAAADLSRSPRAWSDLGTAAEVLQELKLLWHVLVRYGKPLSEA
ncbi:DUF3626 domain-containing protein [Paenibacillus humicola]|uniref:DUF3626 domain-containing protein n=1 Tax=Paenibacillus humicola TaxID=3110540 RepID=UPI00237A3BBD|nr:DUF3626 domain-containing protein [Paenibacillus humicola]